MNNPPLIIAEAGLNHNGSLDSALDLAEAALAAGADVVKYQTAVPELECAAGAMRAPYQGEGDQLAMIRALNLSFPETRKLARHCQAIGIEFCSTPADEISLRFLVEECGVRRIKIGSGDLTNLPMLLAAANINLPVILSTGMASLAEVVRAVNVFPEAKRRRRGDVILLHCVSAYPARKEDSNLLAMATLQRNTGLLVGWSDHTEDYFVPVLAAAMGAGVIEKHLTLNRDDKGGPDHRLSLEPREFRSMIDQIGMAMKAMGNGEKMPVAAELENLPMVRKSIVAAKAIRAGEAFSRDNIGVKRPGIGRHPFEFFATLGQIAKRNYAEDEVLE